MMNSSAMLSPRRESFNPKNPEHLRSYFKFVTERKWGTVMFILEPQFSSVPEMVAQKFAVYMLTRELAKYKNTEKEPA